MGIGTRLTALVLVVATASGWGREGEDSNGFAAEAAQRSQPAAGATLRKPPPDDQFTPVTVAPLTRSVQAVIGTDGKLHVVYELMLANAGLPTVTLSRLEVLDASDPSRVIASYQGSDLTSRLSTLRYSFPGNAEIEFSGARLLLLHLEFPAGADVPRRLLHRLEVFAQGGVLVTTAALSSYTAPPFAIAMRPRVAVIGPPLTGKGWIAVNGCCEANRSHRITGLPVNGGIHFTERFGIDWLRLDDQGRIASGDLTDVRSYAAYGADLLAVADGVVVAALDTLDDSVPAQRSRPPHADARQHRRQPRRARHRRRLVRPVRALAERPVGSVRRARRPCRARPGDRQTRQHRQHLGAAPSCACHGRAIAAGLQRRALRDRPVRLRRQDSGESVGGRPVSRLEGRALRRVHRAAAQVPARPGHRRLRALRRGRCSNELGRIRKSNRFFRQAGAYPATPSSGSE